MKKDNKQRYPVIRLAAVISISILMIAVMGLITFDNNTILVFQQIDYFCLFILFLLWIGLKFIDTLSLFLYTKGFTREITIYGAFRAISIRIFYNIITPFNCGGQPAVVKELTRYNITYGNGYSIVFNKLFIYTCISTTGG
ncbi:MAG: flippase-like domain-containing protein, partial [Spirochaetales bacterium]|nr:flippase-like domain-containing protein [Spirochaetales bacterium]